MVQRRTTRGHGENGAQTTLHTSTPRRTGLRAPGDQQNTPVNNPKILVAKHAARHLITSRDARNANETRSILDQRRPHFHPYFPYMKLCLSKQSHLILSLNSPSRRDTTPYSR